MPIPMTHLQVGVEPHQFEAPLRVLGMRKCLRMWEAHGGSEGSSLSIDRTRSNLTTAAGHAVMADGMGAAGCSTFLLAPFLLVRPCFACGATESLLACTVLACTNTVCMVIMLHWREGGNSRERRLRLIKADCEAKRLNRGCS